MWFRGSDKIVSGAESNMKGNSLTLSVQSSHDGEYVCQAELHDRKVTTGKSAPHSLTVKVPPKPKLSIMSKWKTFYQTEKLSLKCSVSEDSNKWDYEWFRNGSEVHKDEDISFSGDTLSISSAKAAHSGQYTCRGKHQTRTPVTTGQADAVQLHVQALPKPQIQSEWTEAFTGEEVSLQCLIPNDSENWTYMWFRGSDKIVSGAESNMKGNSLTLSVQSSHDGEYVCQAELHDRKVTTEKSAPHSLTVKVPPKPKLSITSKWKTFYQTEKLSLKCSVSEDSNKWDYEWFRNGSEVHKDEDISFSGDTLSISSAKAAHSGQYTCRGKHQTRTPVTTGQADAVQLHVQALPKLQIQSEWTEAFPSEKVSLQCLIQNDSENWTYMWFRGSDKIVSGAESNMKGNSLTLSVQSSHDGEYVCQAELHHRKVTTEKSAPHSLKVHGSQPTILLRQVPPYPEIYTGEQVKLTCGIKERTSKWQYLWEKNSKQVNTDLSNPNYTIPKASLSQKGEYTCQIRRREMTFTKSTNLTIKMPPKPKLSITSKWKTFYQTEKLSLKCSVSEDSNKWDYEWFRNGSEVHKNEDISFSGDTLSISSAKAAHSGQYTCRGKHQTRTPVTTGQADAVQLQIDDITPNPTITKHEWFELFYTEERLHLDCNMSGVGWVYHWHKDSNHLITNPELTIKSVSHSNTGDYYCKAKRGDFSVDSETLQLRVEARPPALLSLETELGDIMTGYMTLRCNVSDGRNWNYTWFMDGQQLNASSDVLRVTGNEENIRREFKCKGINTVRPLYSALSDGFIANNIIFKRKILLAISGCLVCCFIILIIGCIVLKITRKPEVKDTAQEDLFFSMTDFKNQTASPMKEYMDNRPSELEDCEEKEELITDRASAAHEDAVIKDEEKPASEANGLTSFKGF
ncbi:titin [Puntigrus tetrazona]|uniref:titin n=1 Tax=Puntigrus tetrazona TaxID=1606681 RepID=UPI001C8A1D65|nr:titin [Puntigrus tetrazona]